MITEEFLSNNVLSLIVLVLCLLGSGGLMIYNRKREKGEHATLVHVSQFIMWALGVIILGDFAEQGIDHFQWRFITADTVGMICTTLIVLMLIRKLFLMINRLAAAQIKRGSDITSAHIVSRVLKILIVIVVFLFYGEHFGMSLSGLLTFGGIGGIAIGMALYIPNSLFSSISVENPGRMTNRRIKTTIGLRYEDAEKISQIVSEIRAMLKAESSIDQHQTLLVYFDELGVSALNIMVYCFTKTTVWAEWLAAQQAVYLKIIEIVHRNGADFAFPSRTLYMERNSVSREPPGV